MAKLSVLNTSGIAGVEANSLSARAACLEKGALVGDSEAMQRVRALIERVAGWDSTVLICGETGTGKELVARAIHRYSHRAAGPMVCVNCSAIPDSLTESELFGSEKGAFTGAFARHDGQIKQADRGTLLLDEIGDMSLTAQAKLLRAVETREVQRLGASRPETVDVRFLAATHQDLQKLMSERQFRSDLFYRLNVLTVRLPPLRERVFDIPQLTHQFLREFNSRYGRNVSVSSAGMRVLMNHDWPGNIRELRNVLERAFVTCSSAGITASDLELQNRNPAAVSETSAMVRSSVVPRLPARPEPDQLLSALQATRWNKSEAARLLHWSRMTIYRKLAKYNLPADAPPEEAPPEEAEPIPQKAMAAGGSR
jgi:DNA-binding NtrC family response regulator